MQLTNFVNKETGISLLTTSYAFFNQNQCDCVSTLDACARALIVGGVTWCALKTLPSFIGWVSDQAGLLKEAAEFDLDYDHNTISRGPR